MSEDIERKVKNILIAQLAIEPEKVKPDSKVVEDLGADSLDTVELVMALEDEFEFDIPDEDSERMRTVEDITSYIIERKKE